MNKYLLIGLIVAVLIGGVMFIADSQQDTKSEVLNNGKMDQAKQSQNFDNNSKYIEYSKEAFNRASNSRRVLYFYASWCPTCRPADADFRTSLNKFPEDLVLIRVNYNDPDTDQEEKELAKKYAVTYQHTFVQIDGQGKEIKKWNGGKTEELLVNIR